jgi:hypothetical protein
VPPARDRCDGRNRGPCADKSEIGLSCPQGSKPETDFTFSLSERADGCASAAPIRPARRGRSPALPGSCSAAVLAAWRCTVGVRCAFGADCALGAPLLGGPLSRLALSRLPVCRCLSGPLSLSGLSGGRPDHGSLSSAPGRRCPPSLAADRCTAGRCCRLAVREGHAPGGLPCSAARLPSAQSSAVPAVPAVRPASRRDRWEATARGPDR